MAIQNIHNKIDIYVHADIVQKRTNSVAEKSVNPNSNEASGNSNDSSSAWSGGTFHISKKRMIHMGINATRTIKTLATQYANAGIGQLGAITGDSNYQNIVQRQVESGIDTISSIWNIGSATTSGALIGGPIGAALALASSSLSTAFSLMNKYETRNMQNAISTWKENQSVNYNKARAGIELTDGRTRLR